MRPIEPEDAALYGDQPLETIWTLDTTDLLAARTRGSIKVIHHPELLIISFQFFNTIFQTNSLLRLGCTPPKNWSTLTSDFSATNNRKDMKLFVYVSKTS